MYTFTHRNPEMQIDKTHTALMLADMQNEFLEEKKEGTYYALIEDALKKRNVIANLEQLLKTAQDLGYFIVHSPHWYYPTDGQWVVPAGASMVTFDRVLRPQGPCRPGGFSQVQSRLLRTVQKVPNGRAHLQHVAAQALWMRGERRDQAAPDAQGREGDYGGSRRKYLLKSHMRDIIEAGIEVAMVRDAVAAGVNDEGDGYAAAMVNWRFMANAVWTTDETVKKMKAAASA